MFFFFLQFLFCFVWLLVVVGCCWLLLALVEGCSLCFLFAGVVVVVVGSS